MKEFKATIEVEGVIDILIEAKDLNDATAKAEKIAQGLVIDNAGYKGCEDADECIEYGVTDVELST